MIRDLIEKQKIDESLKIIWIKISKSNKYIDEQAPWNLKNKDFDRMNTILYCLLESIRQIGIFIQPAIPESSNKILNILNIEKRNRNICNLPNKLLVGTDIKKQELIFPRIQ